MADPSLFDLLRLPGEWLVALDNRDLRFAMQRWHYLIRLSHIVSTAAFFGAIAVVDLRLAGLWRAGALDAFVRDFRIFLYVSFAVATTTGTALFAYDPLHVGSHAYFTPKLLLIALALVNAAAFTRFGLRAALTNGAPPPPARLAGLVSLTLWLVVMTCAALNVEDIPKVFLR